jgi:hypothetical protein
VESDRQERRPIDAIKKHRDDFMKREYMSRMVPFAKARELLMRVKMAGITIVLATRSRKSGACQKTRLRRQIRHMMQEAAGKLGILTIGLTCGG